MASLGILSERKGKKKDRGIDSTRPKPMNRSRFIRPFLELEARGVLEFDRKEFKMEPKERFCAFSAFGTCFLVVEAIESMFRLLLIVGDDDDDDESSCWV